MEVSRRRTLALGDASARRRRRAARAGDARRARSGSTRPTPAASALVVDRGRRPTSSSTPAAARCCCAPIGARRRRGVEVLALDRGPGHREPRARARATASRPPARPGTGLGAIARLGDRASTSTRAAGSGTAVFARVAPADAPARRRPLRRRRRLRPLARRDGVRRRLGGRSAARGASLVLVADGLGHGPRRAAAARAAARASSQRAQRARAGRDPRAHRTTRCGRRAAPPSAVAEIDRAARRGALRRRRQHRRHASLSDGADAQPGLAQRHARPRRAPHPGVHVPVAAGALLVHALRRPRHRAGRSTRYPGLRERASRADRRRAVPRLSPRPRRRHGASCVTGAPRDAADPDASRSATSRTSCWRASARARSRRCSASTRRTRRASPPRSRRSRATPSATRGGGKVEFALEGSTRAAGLRRCASATRARASPTSPPILDGRYRSPTGMGLGIVGARRLMDRFDIDVARRAGHDASSCKKILPRAAPLVGPRRRWRRSPSELARRAPRDPLDEVQQQNQELLRALDELRAAAGRARARSTASSRTPTAAWSRSMPSSTRRPTTCAAPTR